MLFYTHLIFGFLTALLTYKYIPMNKYLFFMIVLFASILPDIDDENSKINNKLKLTKIFAVVFRHRTIFHSLIAPLVLFLLIDLFFGFNYGIALFIGYLSHLFIDGFTKAGINFLHPILTLKMHGFIETGSLGEKLLAIGLAVVVVVLVV